jgi:hypothetical protein
MYFDPAGDDAIDPAKDGRLNFLLAASTAVALLFIAFPGPLLTSAEAAAQALLK